MSQVFISYRQINDDQRKRVREFAEKLRDAGIEVILDQFFLEKNPGGPNDGWDKWSSDNALKAEYVLVIGNYAWFQCFEKTQPPGTGLGAACEADDLRQRIYDAGGVVENIRIVVFDEADATNTPGKLKRYHRFHAEIDLNNIVKWLGGKIPCVNNGSVQRTTIPHNLPALQSFYGREDELKKIADALDPESRTWGALIDGPGGMGKTSLAIRAAHNVPADAFDRIVFVTLKSREMEDDGERKIPKGFLISGLSELFNELAREIKRDDIPKAIEEDRPRILLDALRDTRTLLILDNLESLTKEERDTVFFFVKKLPQGCKAILTSRGRIGSSAEELILEKIGESAALAVLEELSIGKPALAKTSVAERLELYRETGGKPLLLRWTAGQIGRGNCLTLSDAVAYLRSCPEGNDPLEFIFGDLVEDFSTEETNVLCALTYFTMPAKMEHIAGIAECSLTSTDGALRNLINRSLVVPDEELTTFSLIPLVTDFLQKKRSEIMEETGNRLKKRGYALTIENGGLANIDRFPVIYAEWPIISAALPLFFIGSYTSFKSICTALFHPLGYAGRYDESLALFKEAERIATLNMDFKGAGWNVYNLGWTYSLREQHVEVFLCADRAESYWNRADVGVKEKAWLNRLKGLGCKITKDYSSALAFFDASLELLNSMSTKENADMAIVFADIGNVERLLGNYEAARSKFNEALRIAQNVNDREGLAANTGNLAVVALDQCKWEDAEKFAEQGLALSEKIGRLELIGNNNSRLAHSLIMQGKKSEALPHALRGLEILTPLSSQNLPYARKILALCQE